MGLSLCRTIAEAHQAKIELESEPTEEGARFVLEIPLLEELP